MSIPDIRACQQQQKSQRRAAADRSRHKCYVVNSNPSVKSLVEKYNC